MPLRVEVVEQVKNSDLPLRVEVVERVTNSDFYHFFLGF